MNISDAPLISRKIKWLLLESLYKIIRDTTFEIYFKVQLFFKEYIPAIKQYFACLYLIIYSLYQNQLIIIFRVIFLDK